MSRKSLIKELKKINPALKIREIDKIINIFCDSIKFELRNRKSIELRGFGTFFIKKIREKHSARNPKTGDLIYVPEKSKIRFRVSKILQKTLND